MIRILVNASSPIARAGLVSLLQAHPALRVIEDYSDDAPGMAGDSPPDVWLVEAGTLADPVARKAMDWAMAGGPVVMLVHNPVAEVVAEALRAGVKGVLGSGRTGPEIVAAIFAAAAGLVALDASGIDAWLRVSSVNLGAVSTPVRKRWSNR